MVSQNPATMPSTPDTKQSKRKSTSTHLSPQESSPDDERKHPADPNYSKPKQDDKKHQTRIPASLKAAPRTDSLVQNLEKGPQRSPSPKLPHPPPPPPQPNKSGRGNEPRDAQLGRGGRGRVRPRTPSTTKTKTISITPSDELPPVNEQDDEDDSLVSLQ